MSNPLHIDAAEANLRATPGTNQAPLARLPVGHAVVPTTAPQGAWQPCDTQLDGHTLSGFVHGSLLRAPIGPEVDALVQAAGIEYRRFAFGALHETHPDASARIRDYWLSFATHAEPVSVAWSAAFVSFVVRQAALPLSFRFSGRHTDYLSDSKRALLQADTTRAYWAVRLDEPALRVGDMVGAYRTGADCGNAVRTYDSLPGDFCAHCDIVVAIRSGIAVTIGGNVSNTVKVTEVALTPDGRAVDGKKRFVVMTRNF